MQDSKTVAPRISALFSTFNRSALLDKALESLVGQTLAKNEFEVIVIDDGSSDGTRDVVAAYAGRLPVVYAYQSNQGLAEGKNHGIRLARAPIVVFMDDDDVASERLLQEHLETHRRYPKEEFAVLGYTDLREDLAKLPLMHFVTQVGCYLFSYPRLRHGDILDYTYFWGGRSSCKRSLLLDRGLFDPVFKFGCEDIELGYRLEKSGFRVVYNRNARSTMIRAMTVDEFCHRVERQGRANYIFSQMHPSDEIQRWTDVVDLEERWFRVRDCYAAMMDSARHLDALANSRIAHGFELDEMVLELTHGAYWRAINASRLKGSVEQKIASCQVEQPS